MGRTFKGLVLARRVGLKGCTIFRLHNVPEMMRYGDGEETEVPAVRGEAGDGEEAGFPGVRHRAQESSV